MKVQIKKLTLMAILAAIALIIFIIEAQIPLPVPIPGVKLGLANAVTLFALFYGTDRSFSNKATSITSATLATQAPTDSQNTVKVAPTALTTINVLTILLCRITLGAIFTGRLVAFAYSITGGLLAFIAQVIMKRYVSKDQIWVCGAIGAVFHNIGQIAAAMVVTGTPSIAAYLPILIITGVLTGTLTGLVAQIMLQRLSNTTIG